MRVATVPLGGREGVRAFPGKDRPASGLTRGLARTGRGALRRTTECPCAALPRDAETRAAMRPQPVLGTARATASQSGILADRARSATVNLATATVDPRSPPVVPSSAGCLAVHCPDQQRSVSFAQRRRGRTGVEHQPAQRRQPSERFVVRDRIRGKTQPHELRQLAERRDLPQPVRAEVHRCSDDASRRSAASPTRSFARPRWARSDRPHSGIKSATRLGGNVTGSTTSRCTGSENPQIWGREAGPALISLPHMGDSGSGGARRGASGTSGRWVPAGPTVVDANSMQAAATR